MRDYVKRYMSNYPFLVQRISNCISYFKNLLRGNHFLREQKSRIEKWFRWHSFCATYKRFGSIRTQKEADCYSCSSSIRDIFQNCTILVNSLNVHSHAMVQLWHCKCYDFVQILNFFVLVFHKVLFFDFCIYISNSSTISLIV